ncbi:MAG: FAD:protein FMN transferase [Pseudomonadota bacterium]
MPIQVNFSRRTFMLMPLAFAACKPGQDVLQLSGPTMGTGYNVVVSNAPVGEAEIQSAIGTALAQVNAAMSNWSETSEISRFNASDAPTMLSPELAEVMDAAEAVNTASEGTFDTTMGPLIELWGFGAPGKAQMPSDVAIAAAQARSGHANTLRIGAGAMEKQQADAQVYLAAIGKGYGADHVCRALEALGITDYMVEIGGDLYAAGRNPDGMPWQIGVETPDARDRSVMDVVGVSGLGMASSGDYRNYYEQDGQRYSHVIDPSTGRPITHTTASATVLAENAMLADAWATAMLTLGRDRGMAIAEREGLAVMFIERDTDATDRQFKMSRSRRFEALTA